MIRVPRGKNKAKKIIITGDIPTLVVHCVLNHSLWHAWKVLQTDTNTTENAGEREKEKG